MVVYLLNFVLFGCGVYALMTRKNIIKMVIGLSIMEYAVNLFFIFLGYKTNGQYAFPIFFSDQKISFNQMVDPLPQALILTAIVIGLATTALFVAIAIRLYEKYNTFDISRIRRLRG